MKTTYQIIATFRPITHEHPRGSKTNVSIRTNFDLTSINSCLEYAADDYIDKVIQHMMDRFNWICNDNWWIKKVNIIEYDEALGEDGFDYEYIIPKTRKRISRDLTIAGESALPARHLSKTDIVDTTNGVLTIKLQGKHQIKFEVSMLYSFFTLKKLINSKNQYLPADATIKIGDLDNPMIELSGKSHWSMIANDIDVYPDEVEKPSILDMPEAGFIFRDDDKHGLQIIIIDRDRSFEATIDAKQFIAFALRHGLLDKSSTKIDIIKLLQYKKASISLADTFTQQLQS